MRLGLLVIIAQLVACFAGCADAQQPPASATPARSVHAPPKPALVQRKPRVIEVVAQASNDATQPALLKPAAKILHSGSTTSLQSLPANPLPAKSLAAKTSITNNPRPADPGIGGIRLATGGIPHQASANATRAHFIQTTPATPDLHPAAHTETRPVRASAPQRSLQPVGTNILPPSVLPPIATRKRQGTTESAFANRTRKASLRTMAAELTPIASPEVTAKERVEHASNACKASAVDAAPKIASKQTERRTKLLSPSPRAVGTTPTLNREIGHDGQPRLKPFSGHNDEHETTQVVRDSIRPKRRSQSAAVLPPVGDLPVHVSVDRMPIAYNHRDGEQPEVIGLRSVHHDIPKAEVVAPVETHATSGLPAMRQTHASTVPALASGAIQPVGHTVDRTNSTRRHRSTLQPPPRDCPINGP